MEKFINTFANIIWYPECLDDDDSDNEINDIIDENFDHTHPRYKEKIKQKILKGEKVYSETCFNHIPTRTAPPCSAEEFTRVVLQGEKDRKILKALNMKPLKRD